METPLLRRSIGSHTCQILLEDNKSLSTRKPLVIIVKPSRYRRARDTACCKVVIDRYQSLFIYRPLD